MSQYKTWESGQFQQNPDQTVIALQTPADKECTSSVGVACPGCRTYNQIGGDREKLLSSLNLEAANTKDVLMYCTSKQATDLRLAREFMLKFQDRGINTKVRPLIHEILAGTNLEGIDSIEISKSGSQTFNTPAQIATESGVKVIASLIAGANGKIFGTNLNTKESDIENKIADHLMETSGVQIAAAYIRAFQNPDLEINPTESLIFVNSEIDPQLVAPIKVYNEFKGNQGITPNILLNPYGQKVSSF
jgi:hypothetical protein